MYKSSSFTFVYKYLFTPIWSGLFFFGILSSWNSEDEFIHHWSRGAAMIAGWALVWLIILMIRLRNAEAHHDHLLIKSFHGDKKIKYQNIEYVTDLAMISPRLISIKYNDTNTGNAEKIFIMPATSPEVSFTISKEHEMTKFIRQQIMKNNPFYTTDREPSRWSAVRIILLTGIPIMIYFNFFIMKMLKVWEL